MLFAVFSLAAFAAPATAGWENWNPMRREVAPARIVWQADFSDVKHQFCGVAVHVVSVLKLLELFAELIVEIEVRAYQKI